MTDIAKAISTNVADAGKTSSTCSECDMWSGRHLRTCSALAARSPEALSVIQAAIARGVPAADAIELFRVGWKSGKEASSTESQPQAQAASGTRWYKR